MKRISKLIVLFLAIFLVFGYRTIVTSEAGTVQKGGEGVFEEAFWNTIIADSINGKTIKLTVDGAEVMNPGGKAYMDESMNLMIPISLLQEGFDCAANIYNEELRIEKSEDVITYSLSELDYVEEQIYIPILDVIDAFDYVYEWNSGDNEAVVESKKENTGILPAKYDYREGERQPEVRDQGTLGTCWAFASLTALESSVLPEEIQVFAADHMSINNSFGLSQNDGGEYTMSIAYLTSWSGPVLEKDDPYGDGVSPEGLEPVKHVQEVQIIEDKDYEEMKKAVYKYGGVQTSIYNSLTNSLSYAKEYNRENRAYCFSGEKEPNHEVVIIGWDDHYPKENFNGSVPSDGAFICQNSWGKSFADDGVFYISYNDSNIGMNSVVYTKVEDNDNYDSIYQADLCGWTGQLGYGTESAYFANVYTADKNEKLEAAGFYATEVDTEYTIYAVDNFKSSQSLRDSIQVAQGKVKNKGFYTVPFEKAVKVKKGQQFAVIVEIKSPGTTYPVAVEYKGEGVIKEIDLSDGEGYISQNGLNWENTEKKYSCNICLKVYTRE